MSIIMLNTYFFMYIMADIIEHCSQLLSILYATINAEDGDEEGDILDEDDGTIEPLIEEYEGTDEEYPQTQSPAEPTKINDGKMEKPDPKAPTKDPPKEEQPPQPPIAVQFKEIVDKIREEIRERYGSKKLAEMYNERYACKLECGELISRAIIQEIRNIQTMHKFWIYYVTEMNDLIAILKYTCKVFGITKENCIVYKNKKEEILETTNTDIHEMVPGDWVTDADMKNR